MNKLIIIRGNSGSGKTTVAKMLQQKLGLNTLLISQDVVRREMAYVKDGQDNSAIPLLIKLLEHGHANNRVTILEGIFYQKWYANLFEIAKALYKDEIYAYYYELEFEETLKRHSTKANAKEFGEDTMRRWWIEKDYLDLVEEKTIQQHEKAEEVVARIFSEIKR